ncbi:uncharacterized protein [Montipora foliosa]|uniref:uncharacterized protein n=1 Tax=Montipora foliosa TaxID=591990 RepID=UPI0035F1B9D6
MDRQEVTLLVLLDLSAAFDTIDHRLLVDLLQRDLGVDDLALSWLKLRVVIDQQQSRDFCLATGVSQGSCLGPILFIIYASRLFHVRKKHLPTMQGYADDTQLYVSFRAGSDASQDVAIRAMENYICDIRRCMTHHQLMLNDGKTDSLQT